MKGLIFLIENKVDNFLYKILNNLPSQDYKWRVTENEVYTKYKENEKFVFDDFFDKKLYSSEEFIKKIKKDCYLVFCNIQMYKKDSIINEIKTINDFYKSDCELILLVTDNIYVEVYSKNEDYLSIIKNNLLKSEITKWEYKDIDKRLSMYAHGD